MELFRYEGSDTEIVRAVVHWTESTADCGTVPEAHGYREGREAVGNSAMGPTGPHCTLDAEGNRLCGSSHAGDAPVAVHGSPIGVEGDVVRRTQACSGR